MKHVKAEMPAMSKSLLLPLYNLAKDFFEEEPCSLLNNSHIFALQDPISGVIGYIVLEADRGNLETFCIYRGKKSLQQYLTDDLGEVNQCDALVLDYVTPKELPSEEKAFVQELSSHWAKESLVPSFRSFVPEFQGWYLSDEEVYFFTLALECAVAHIKECRSDQELMLSGKEGCYQLYRMQEGAFKRASHTPVPAPIEKEPPYTNPAKVEGLKDVKLCRDGAWEASVFYTPSLIRENDRPYFGRVLMLVHQESLLVLQVQVAEPGVSSSTLLGDELLSAIKTHKRLPSEVILNDEELYEGLRPLAKSLGIELSIADVLPATKPAKESLIEHMK